MWILRFHLLQTKDYNKVQRICKKYGFITKRHSPILYAKASVKHVTQGASWRALRSEFGIDHISLYKFYENAKRSEMLEEIFHVFLRSRTALYIADTKYISTQDLDNSEEIFDLTQRQFQNILKGL